MRRKKVQPISAGSMADVAFLLLIFFLVTTTIQTEAGLQTTLPQWSEEYQKVNEKYMLTIQLNQEGALLINNQKAHLKELPFYLTQLLDKVSPQKAIVHLEHDQQVDYANYIAVYNAIKADYKARWESMAMAKYGRSFENLEKRLQQGIQKKLPLALSEKQWGTPE